jgi:hypothetical protein
MPVSYFIDASRSSSACTSGPLAPRASPGGIGGAVVVVVGGAVVVVVVDVVVVVVVRPPSAEESVHALRPAAATIAAVTAREVRAVEGNAVLGGRAASSRS